MKRWGIVALLILVLAGCSGAATPTKQAAPAAITRVATVTATATVAKPTSTANPTPTPKPTATSVPTVAVVAPVAQPTAARSSGKTQPVGSDCPAGFPIKGNVNSKKERIYHDMDSGSYNRTKPEECFATPADAEAAGYRAAQD